VRARLDALSDSAVGPLQAQLEALENHPRLAQARGDLVELAQQQAEEARQLKHAHALNRQAREQLRLLSGQSTEADQLSRRDTTQKKQLQQRHHEATHVVQTQVAVLEQEVTAARARLSAVSAQMVKQIIELPTVTNARGQQRPIASLFETAPPGGVGECAAPKLLAEAYRRGLTPVALAEFWWGPTQATGRVRGAYVPACKAKCGQLLPYMLEGLEVSEPRRVISRVGPEIPLRVLYEDQHLRVIEKPEGLLSVSGREATHIDAVETRMPGTWVVHRLDLDTSGALILALDAETHVALQQQFSRREVTKRYVALVDGQVDSASGEIALPLRPDVDDRPRQIVDQINGKAATTRWEVISRSHAGTRLALWPLTGRTHQLRVHCAHRLGLNAPIVGDRLYGRAGGRLMLHCELLELRHPVTGEPLRFEAPAPF
jgi:tRNA pseudouridine32 synthase/23S rRNA pseudouridine746 synthase